MAVDISLEPPAPSTFIKIIHHPHSMVCDPTIISLEGEMVENHAQATNSVSAQHTEPMPWAPFRTHADFEYAESAVIGLLSKPVVDKQLRGINGSWAKQSRITFRSYADLEKTLAASRADGVQVFIVGHLSASHETFAQLSLYSSNLDMSQKTLMARPTILNSHTVHRWSGSSVLSPIHHWCLQSHGFRFRNFFVS